MGNSSFTHLSISIMRCAQLHAKHDNVPTQHSKAIHILSHFKVCLKALNARFIDVTNKKILLLLLSENKYLS